MKLRCVLEVAEEEIRGSHGIVYAHDNKIRAGLAESRLGSLIESVLTFYLHANNLKLTEGENLNLLFPQSEYEIIIVDPKALILEL